MEQYKFLLVFLVENSNTIGNFGVEMPTKDISADALPNLISAIQQERNSTDGIILLNIIKLN